MNKERRCQVWGIVNVTPDSFSDGGRHYGVEVAVDHALRLIEEGADVIDIGGQSTRPPGRHYGKGYELVSVEEEIRRVCPVIENLAKKVSTPLSVDTMRAEVAQEAIEAGASIVNDVSGGSEDALLDLAARHQVELVLMHNRLGHAPDKSSYEDVTRDVVSELRLSAENARARGVKGEQIWLDPGIGFAKTAAQSLEVLRGLPVLRAFGHRLLVGPSRKSFIADACAALGREIPDVSARLGGTLAASIYCALNDVDAVRVHDVAAVKQAFTVLEALQRGGSLEISACMH